jgi:hypothetical protein
LAEIRQHNAALGQLAMIFFIGRQQLWDLQNLPIKEEFSF